jgi:hypothetical protein
MNLDLSAPVDPAEQLALLRLRRLPHVGDRPLHGSAAQLRFGTGGPGRNAG